MAEMGAADLWAAQAAEVYSADWNPQEDADAMFPVRFISLLTSTVHLSKARSNPPSSQPTRKPTTSEHLHIISWSHISPRDIWSLTFFSFGIR